MAPSTAELDEARRKSAQRRRVAAATAALVLAAGVAVLWGYGPGAGTSLLFGEPGAADHEDGAAPGTREDDAPEAGEDAGAGDLRELARLVGEGRQVPAGVAVGPDGRLAVVGVTVDEADEAQARPAVWIGEPDGAWRRVQTPLAEDGGPVGDGVFLRGVATTGDGRLVAVGHAEDAGAPPIAWRSEDGGETWQAGPLGDRAGSAEAVAWTGQGFVAVGAADGGSAAWASPDGRVWSPVALDGEPALAAEGILVDVLEHAGGLVLIEQIGDSSRLLAAELAGDGVAGQLRGLGSFAGSLARLAADPGTGALYAAGSWRPEGLRHEPLLLASADGSSWEPLELGRAAGVEHDAGLGDVTVVGSDVVVAGTVDLLPRVWALDGAGGVRAADLPAGAAGPPLLAPALDGVLVVGTVADGDEGIQLAVWHWDL